MINHNQEQLLKRARTLDKGALVEIYDLYSDALYKYAYRFLGESGEAEDLVSETFFRFLSALERGGGPRDHLQAYLYRIAHNLITDKFRRDLPPSLELDEDKLPENKPDPSSILSGKENIDLVRNALRLITPEQREVIVLKYLEGWSSSEIARVMNKSLGAIKALQHRGLAALQRILVDKKNPDPKPDQIT
jgi:RNA polymerase sigma-70 factor (ECF subfamily)